MNDLTNVTTGEVRLSYVHLFKPYAATQGTGEKYSCTILVPKTDTDTMARIQAAIEAAKQKGITDKWNGVCPPIVPTPVYDGDGVRPSDGMEFGPECKGHWVFTAKQKGITDKWNGVCPPIVPTPVYDGDGVRPSDGMEFGPECKGHWVFTANAKADYPPEVVDKMVNPIINQSEVYSGMYGRVNVTFFPYTFGGKKGIGCGLGSVQKLRDGEPLSGSAPSAAQAFGTPTPQNGMAAQPGYTPEYGGNGYAPQNQVGQASYGQPVYGAVNPITGQPY